MTSRINPSISTILAALEGATYARRYLVFGSVARQEQEPKDLDLAVDLRERRFTGEIPAEARGLLALARRHYGHFDPFLMFSDALLVRDAEATSWVRAKHARALRSDVLSQGVSLGVVLERLQADAAAIGTTVLEEPPAEVPR
ncbi:hypothetical protein [Variovorax sp. JS1663]|uniref:hypothetical protein n=1 Tax=Variovorax sp. JS1663 TaxID=1851577 RepID=UPI000B3469DC|nr:hypothetical protein [Variovorax sp. JS1663]OUM04488.1 hypothetical protein A8M77_02055 [Variovorax sp. JS1663]